MLGVVLKAWVIVFLTGLFAVVNNARYQSIANEIQSHFHLSFSQISLLFSIASLCGFFIGLIVLFSHMFQKRIRLLSVLVIFFQAFSSILPYVGSSSFKVLMAHRVIEGLVFFYIMTFYPVTLALVVKENRREFMMNCWALIFAVGFAVSNFISLLVLPFEVKYLSPPFLLVILLSISRRTVVSSIENIKPLPKSQGSFFRIDGLNMLKLIFVALPFFTFTLTYNHFIFNYKMMSAQQVWMPWLLLLNATCIVCSNLLITLRKKMSSIVLLAVLFFILSVQITLGHVSHVMYAAMIFSVLGFIEGMIFGYFVNLFELNMLPRVKATYTISGSLGATLGPIVSIHYGSFDLLRTLLYISCSTVLLLSWGISFYGKQENKLHAESL